MAKNYCLIGDTDNAMKNLLLAEKAAVEIDNFIKKEQEQQYTSLLLNKLKADPQGVLKHWQGSHCYKLYTQLQDECFNTMRDMLEFKELEQRLG